MNYYSYKAIDPGGAVLRGMTKGNDEAALRDEFKSKGLFVLQIKKSSGFAQKIQAKLKARQIQRKDIIELATNLSIMLHAGVPIFTALEDLATGAGNDYYRSVIRDVIKNIEMGTRFSDALNLHPAVFPDVLIRLVMVGEETGRLEESLKEAAAHLQKMDELASTVKNALIYPCFSLITTGAALIFWLGFVLPKILKIITGLGMKLPLLTRILIVLSNFTQKYWFIAPLIPVFVFLIVKVMQMRPQGRYYWDLAKLKIPIIKILLYNKLLALLSEQLRLMISAGITIDKCMDMAAEVIGNEVFKRAILTTRNNIIAGGQISESLSAFPIFPPLYVRMVAIGEASGSLDKQFGFLTDHYYKVVDDFSNKIGKMIEPILMIVMGGLLGTMIAGVMLPMYDMFSKIG